MNHQEKMLRLKSIFDYCLAVMDAKGRDYSGTEDAMSNFHDFGWRGIVTRLGDKYHRLKNLSTGEAAVKDESVEDTLRDLIGYAALALVQKATEDDEASRGMSADELCTALGMPPGHFDTPEQAMEREASEMAAAAGADPVLWFCCRRKRRDEGC